ncbi:MAG TPA: SDR family NAD(P)-dependent oxidoreductase, partial [Rhodospirillales bacterium]|nr:SDR family NAD(P)-dependent oxidoreductase [Rhodospirillales bacterium]
MDLLPASPPPIHGTSRLMKQRRALAVPTILVTGATRGLGLALVEAYARRGWRVHACCRNPDRAHALQGVGGDVVLHRLDVRDQTAYRPLADALIGEAIDVLIANAGIAGPEDRIEMLDIPAWFETFHV